MINALNIYKSARDMGCTKAYTECKELVAQYNEKLEKITLEGSPYTIELWDKVSPINSVGAEVFFKENTYPFEAVYILNKNGTTQYVQFYNPNQAGYVPMTEAEALACATSLALESYKGEVQKLYEEEILENLIM